MSKSHTPGVHDIGFFRNIGIVLVTVALTAGSITLSLTLKSNDNVMANLTPVGSEISQ